MSQPPYPPPGGGDAGDDRGADDPTRRLRPPGAQSEGQRDETRQFDRPGPYGQPPQPPYGPPYAAPHGPPGPPPYGPPGPPPYGPPGPQQWGPQWGPPGTPPPKRNRSTGIALAVAAVVVLAALGVAFWLLRGGGGTPQAPGATATSSSTTRSPEETTSSSSPTSSPSRSPSTSTPTSSSPTGEDIPPATVPPDGLGDEPVLDEFAEECFDGSMESCDLLALASEDGTDYQVYGLTCAGRQAEDTGELCGSAFPGG
jgi:hypothetical protein